MTTVQHCFGNISHRVRTCASLSLVAKSFSACSRACSKNMSLRPCTCRRHIQHALASLELINWHRNNAGSRSNACAHLSTSSRLSPSMTAINTYVLSTAGRKKWMQQTSKESIAYRREFSSPLPLRRNFVEVSLVRSPLSCKPSGEPSLQPESCPAILLPTLGAKTIGAGRYHPHACRCLQAQVDHSSHGGLKNILAYEGRSSRSHRSYSSSTEVAHSAPLTRHNGGKTGRSGQH